MFSRSDLFFWSFIHADLLKTLKFRIFWMAAAGIPLAMYLFVFRIFHIENVAAHREVGNFIAAMPLIWRAFWETSLLQFFLMGFGAYCMAVESQSGMIRMICAQPLSRGEYVLGKLLVLAVAVALLTGVVLASLCAWSVLYAGVHNLTGEQGHQLLRFSISILFFNEVWALTAACVGLLRRDTTSAITAAVIVFVGTALAGGMGPSHWWKYILTRYYFFPLKYFGTDGMFFGANSVWSFYDFLLAGAIVLVPTFGIAYLHFLHRDITE